MTTPETDLALCKALAITPDALFSARQEWQTNLVMRRILGYEIEQLMTVERRKLESCQPEDLKTIQGSIGALKRAHAVVMKEER